MLKLSNSLTNTKVMSLRSGGQVGFATSLIINPKNLKVEGWHVKDSITGEELILVKSEVRNISAQGIVINDHEVLAQAEELVRLKPVLDTNFELLGKAVVSQSGIGYGKVTDFAVETESLIIKKIYASQSIIKSLGGGSRSIDRTQIVEVTGQKIIIEDPTEKANDALAAVSPAN